MSLGVGEGTLGLLGGGQLGRLTAIAARHLGLGVVVLDGDPRCAAAAVADRVIVAPFDDLDAARELAECSSVVTLEIERIDPGVVAAAAARRPTYPSAATLATLQDRGLQKRWLEEQGFPVGPWRLVGSGAEATAATAALGGRVRLKACHGGYDGRGQLPVARGEAASDGFARLGAPTAVAERELQLDGELSVLVARRRSGECAVYPIAQNWHQQAILEASVIPAPIAGPLATAAAELGRRIALALDLVGLLAVELFLVDGELLVNELAPRPHNTFHTTELACLTGQFEQLVRAVFDLPLGATDLVRPTALVNLLGDLWLDPARRPDFAAALASPGVQLRLYGKSPRPGRKLGHLLAVDHSAAGALATARLARRALQPDA